MASLSDETLAYVATLTNFDSSLFLGIIFILVIVIPPFFVSYISFKSQYLSSNLNGINWSFLDYIY